MLRKTPITTVISGTPGQAYKPASYTCTPKPPDGTGGDTQPPTVYWTYVPNNPNDFNAGEVRTRYTSHPGTGYTCSFATYFEPDADGVLQPVYENRCYWNY